MNPPEGRNESYHYMYRPPCARNNRLTSPIGSSLRGFVSTGASFSPSAYRLDSQIGSFRLPDKSIHTPCTLPSRQVAKA